MKPPVSTFTSIYAEWLDTFRAMLPGGSPTALAREPTPKEAQVASNQEWEDEGGAIKPEKTTDPAPGSKIPL